jgi:hypothetical protein
VPYWQFREIPIKRFIAEIKFCEFLNI